MGDSAEKLLAKLASLNDSLDDLEEKLEPLLAQTLPESLLPLETLQQVKLNVALPYLVYDLVFSEHYASSPAGIQLTSHRSIPQNAGNRPQDTSCCRRTCAHTSCFPPL